MPSSSSAPCTLPSSPWRPCNAMKQRANASRLSSTSSRSAGSKACASTPCARNAASTPVPDISEISRSAEVPPMSTATLPSASRRRRLNELMTLRCPVGQLDHLRRHVADRARAHRDHHVARPRLVDDGRRHLADVVDEDRIDLAADAQCAGERAAVGRDDGRLAGGVDLGQQHRVGAADDLDEVLEAVAGAGVAVRLEGEHEAALPGNAPRAAAITAAISTGWWP